MVKNIFNKQKDVTTGLHLQQLRSMVYQTVFYKIIRYEHNNEACKQKLCMALGGDWDK